MRFNGYSNVTEVIIPELVIVSNSKNICYNMRNLKTANITSNMTHSCF